jgi:hypothetical protein
MKLVRKIVIEKKLPRRIELMHEVRIKEEDVEYVTFSESFEGIIESQVAHY